MEENKEISAEPHQHAQHQEQKKENKAEHHKIEPKKEKHLKSELFKIVNR